MIVCVPAIFLVYIFFFTRLCKSEETSVALTVRADGGRCVGSFISNDWVLTAAHCVSLRPEHMGLLLPNTGGRIVQVKRVVIYPHNKIFSTRLGFIDIALLQLSNYNRSLTFNFRLSGDRWPPNNQLNRTCTIFDYDEETDSFSSRPTTAGHGEAACPCHRLSFLARRLVCSKAKGSLAQYQGYSGSPLICGGSLVGVASMAAGEDSHCSWSTEHLGIYYIYTCPLLKWISNYVPGVPTEPVSCSAQASLPIATVCCYLLFATACSSNY